MKVCNLCLQLKDDSLFYVDNRNKDGLNNRCIDCNAKYLEEYYENQENKNRRNNIARLSCHNNPIRWLLGRAKKRAKNQNREFSLSEKDVIIPEFCPIFGIPLYVSDTVASDNSISIDRIDNNKGYTPDNIIIVSWKANKIKSQASLYEMQLISNYLLGTFNISRSTIHPSLNTEKYVKELLRTAKKRASVKNLEFSLNKRDIIIPYICPILNLVLERSDKILSDYSPSIDRINNNLGYIPNNIKIISNRANTLKNNSSPEDYLLVFDFYKKLLGASP